MLGTDLTGCGAALRSFKNGSEIFVRMESAIQGLVFSKEVRVDGLCQWSCGSVAARCVISAALIGLTIKLPQLQGLKTHH